jgi:GNAT superfamily N-acetyltransferase
MTFAGEITPMIQASVNLREAVREDVPLILRFIRKLSVFDGAPDAVEATEERLEQTLFADPPLAHVVFAELDGKEVGFASYFFTYSTFLARPGIWLDDLYVDSDARSQGIGRALLVYLARLAKAKGCGRVEWTAAVSNERGLDFYRRNGASIRDRLRMCRLDSQGIDDLISGHDDPTARAGEETTRRGEGLK